MNCPACEAENPSSAAACLACGQDLKSATAVQAGTVLADRYRIDARLGKGGMATVYRARDEVLDEDIALKILRGDWAQAPDLARRFRTEIKLARKVRHRNVCGIHEYGESEGLRYIAMELIEGRDLRQELRQRGALPVDEVANVADQIGGGLEAIHDLGVIHRDLKTSNIMIDKRGVIRLMDFGIAKQSGDQTTGATASGLIIGTPEYMSPEQARGEKVDVRSDVYSFAVVVYELLTGSVPFKADTPLATLLKQLNEPPPLEEPETKRLIAAPLRPILRAALAKDAAHRPASAREFVLALVEAIESTGSQARTLRSSGEEPASASRAGTEATATMRTPTPVPRPAVVQKQRPVPPPRRPDRQRPATSRTQRNTAPVFLLSTAGVMVAGGAVLGWLALSGTTFYSQAPPVALASPEVVMTETDLTPPTTAPLKMMAARAAPPITIAGSAARPERETGRATPRAKGSEQVRMAAAVPPTTLPARASPPPTTLALEPPGKAEPIGAPAPPTDPPTDTAALLETLRDPDAAKRWEATAALMNVGVTALPQLITALSDADANVRLGALQAIRDGGLMSKAPVPTVASKLKDESPAVREATIGALGSAGRRSESAAPQLALALLQDESVEVRVAAAGALARVAAHEPQAVVPLRTAQGGSIDRVRAAAGRALAGFPLETFVAGLSHGEGVVQAACLESLKARGPAAAAAIPALVKLLMSKEWAVRKQAAETLGSLGDSAGEAVPQLARMKGDKQEDPRVRIAATQALIAIQGDQR